MCQKWTELRVLSGATVKYLPYRQEIASLNPGYVTAIRGGDVLNQIRNQSIPNDYHQRHTISAVLYKNVYFNIPCRYVLDSVNVKRKINYYLGIMEFFHFFCQRNLLVWLSVRN